MDPNTFPTPNFGTPPQQNQPQAPDVGGEAAQLVPLAQQAAGIENPVPQPAAVDGASPIVGSVVGDIPAEDGDLIEREWVTRAKTIISQTREDPYRQTQEIHKVKADYLKKRYAKDVKLDE